MSRLLRVSAVLLGLALFLAPGLAAGKPPQSIPSLVGVSSAPDPASVTVDANGNSLFKTKAGVETSFHYDIRDNLGEVRQATSVLGRYGYDYDGRKILKIGAEGRRHYTYDQLSVVTEADEVGVTVSKYDFGLDQLVSLSNLTEGRNFYLDILGSTANLTQIDGSAQESIFHDAWVWSAVASAPAQTASPIPAKRWTARRVSITTRRDSTKPNLFSKALRYI